VKERESKEKRLRCYLMQSREQLKQFTQMKEAEHQSLLKQIKKQEKLLEEVHREKRGMLLNPFLLIKGRKTFKILLTIITMAHSDVFHQLSVPRYHCPIKVG